MVSVLVGCPRALRGGPDSRGWRGARREGAKLGRGEEPWGRWGRKHLSSAACAPGPGSRGAGDA